ncbi:MAG: ABC transporter ATP-binding protein [Zavarzinia sp.]|nr:ABC transporter ATP-binding protein [Zavarzinia sp.]
MEPSDKAVKEHPRLELSGITKAFPGVIANSDVSFKVAPGEIHALLGENGAGKSTLVKQIYGILKPDSGAIVWDGREVDVPSPHAARTLGIGMVFQHFSLFEAMTVLDNVALGMDDPGKDRAALAKRIREVSESYGLPLDPAREVHTLSVGERQRIEVVRCLLQSPRLLVMDEPTSVLTPQEVGKLFETLRKLKAEGCSILYISHKLNEIKELCDQATILRGGKVVAACDPREETARSMAQLMIGAEFRSVARREAGKGTGPIRMELKALSMAPEMAHGVPLKSINLSLRGGEILGIAGVAGNGQGDLLAAIAGERKAATPGAVIVDGKPVGRLGPAARRKLGLCTVPEERNGHGAVPDMSLTDNAMLSAHKRMGFMKGGFLDTAKARGFAAEVIKRFDVRTPGTETAAGSLSGGNLQKFIVGREILQKPEILVVAQPTWGVDAAAAATIQQALVDLAGTGSAILVISQDLDELLTLSDRIAVINAGQVSEAMPASTVSVEEIGLLMGGIHGTPEKGAA